jgi:hypothetical protein
LVTARRGRRAGIRDEFIAAFTADPSIVALCEPGHDIE